MGAGSMMITCLIGLFSGLAVGTNVVLSKVFGSKDMDKFKRGLYASLYVSVIGGIIITIIGELGAQYFLKLINTPDDIMAEAVVYIRIYFISITSMLIYNMGSGIVRAVGNSNTPMTIQLAGGLINIFANALFITVLGWGIKGAALATFFSQTIAASLIIVYILRTKETFHINLKKQNLDTEILKDIFLVGVPAGIQSLVITLSNVVIQSYINSLDVDSIAAFTCYLKVELLVYYTIMAMGQAIMTFTGQNNGAGKIARMKKGTLLCIGAGILITLTLSVFVLYSGEFWFGLFNRNEGVISRGIDIIKITLPFYFIYVILEVLSSSLRGSGKSIPPMIIILSNICVLRIVILYFIAPIIKNVKGIALSYPITWATTSVCMIIFYRYSNKKRDELLKHMHQGKIEDSYKRAE